MSCGSDSEVSRRGVRELKVSLPSLGDPVPPSTTPCWSLGMIVVTYTPLSY